MKRYLLSDMQDNTVKGTMLDFEELVYFVNDIFWQDDDIDFSEASENKLIEICMISEFLVEVVHFV